MVFTSKGGLTYVAEMRNGAPDHKMSHLSYVLFIMYYIVYRISDEHIVFRCFIPGMFALEAMVEKNPRTKSEILQLAEALGHTCHESYRRSTTGIGPEIFYFEPDSEAMTTYVCMH
jgi:mannosyl-oligosaccharide alpha-1,2-mannosidase